MQGGGARNDCMARYCASWVAPPPTNVGGQSHADLVFRKEGQKFSVPAFCTFVPNFIYLIWRGR